ncbi:unnamed protein product [Fusarium venenatum]|uniref:Uncharacterized protein n=1 Tax=Fusarium venenatum TaxID=56646 RepID=A0A2L2T5Z6_9HYPO|nr:uncharacterized protein FVRRES_02724 [Fusarium venenatum]CEI66212.1 unnamed protein product [Fusarium venenatum]
MSAFGVDVGSLGSGTLEGAEPHDLDRGTSTTAAQMPSALKAK